MIKTLHQYFLECQQFIREQGGHLDDTDNFHCTFRFRDKSGTSWKRKLPYNRENLYATCWSMLKINDAQHQGIEPPKYWK